MTRSYRVRPQRVPAEAAAARVFTEVRVDTDGTDLLTVVVEGRLTRPLGMGELKRVPLGARKDEPLRLGRVIVRGEIEPVRGTVVTVEPRKLEGRL